jgi:hypothetical protein
LHDVRVKFLFYSGSFQERCVKHMGRKMLVAMAMEGKFSGEGLNAMGDEDMMTSLARELVEKGGVGESANQIWRDLGAQREKLLGNMRPVVGVALPASGPTDTRGLMELLSDGAGAAMEDVSPSDDLSVEPEDQPAFTGLLQFSLRPTKKKRPSSSLESMEDSPQLLLFA